MAMSDTVSLLEDQLNIIEIESQPLIIPHPLYPDLWTLSEQIELYGNESDQFINEPLAMIRLMGMAAGDSSMVVLSHIASALYIIDERDDPQQGFCHWIKWDGVLRRMFPSGHLDTILAMLDREGFIEHNGDVSDCSLTTRGHQMLLECIGIFDLAGLKL